MATTGEGPGRAARRNAALKAAGINQVNCCLDLAASRCLDLLAEAGGRTMGAVVEQLVRDAHAAMANPSWSPPRNWRMGPERRTFGVRLDAEHLGLLDAVVARMPGMSRYRPAGRSDTIRALIMAAPAPQPDLLIPARISLVRVPSGGERAAAERPGRAAARRTWEIPRYPRARSQRTRLRLDGPTLDRLDELARGTGRSRASVVSMLVLQARVVDLGPLGPYRTVSIVRDDSASGPPPSTMPL